MSELQIEVKKREGIGKSANRKLRGAGSVPAVVYGGGKEPVAIELERKKLIDILRHGAGENSLFLLQMADTGQQRHAMIRDIQIDPVTQRVLHVDFQRVLMTERVQVKVHIELTGLALGVKNEGGIVDFVCREVEVECLPANIPNHLTLDVTPLHVGQHVEARELDLPMGVKLVTEPERVIVSLGHARVETEVAAEGERAEPEVISRGKKEAEE
ncbi:MAG TPA: 50S ribosomal protein L25 [Thermoanaerobaculia bacterium]|nr:50S ribosomal protein L25 [Thermoanaerobaculia bacterium]